MLTGFWRSRPHKFLSYMLDIQVFKSHHWWHYYKSYCKLTTLSPLTNIMEESEKDVSLYSITHLLPQLSKILLTVRNPQLQIALNPLISIQYIHCAGLFYILNKQSNTNCCNTLSEWMDIWKIAMCDSLHDISSDISPQSSSRSQLQARGIHRPFLQENWSAWQGWAEEG